MISDKLHRILREWTGERKIRAREDRIVKKFFNTFGYTPDIVEIRKGKVGAYASITEPDINNNPELRNLLYEIIKTYCTFTGIIAIKELHMKAEESDYIDTLWTVTCEQHASSLFITRKKVEDNIEYTITIIAEVEEHEEKQ